jgi:SSS family solute:Na+ symporter
MISVVLADYVQFVVLSIGLLIATGLAIAKLGWTDIIQTVAEAQGKQGFNPFVEGGPFGVDYVIWMAFLGLVSCALWPTAVARALAAKSELTVRRQFTFASLSFAIRNIVPYFWGIAAFVLILQTPDLMQTFFPEGYPPPEQAAIEPADSLYAMPVFLGRILPAGLLGIISAAMIAAFMSTHDSYFLCWSSVITNDVVAPLVGELTQRKKVLLTRLLIVLIGGSVFTVSLGFPLREDLWDYMAVTGAIYFSGAFALLVAGLYWKSASRFGATLALLAGCLAVFGLETVRLWILHKGVGLSEEFVTETLSSERVGIGVILLTTLCMVAGSLIWPDKDRDQEGAAA